MAALLFLGACAATSGEIDKSQVQSSTAAGARIERGSTISFLRGSGIQGSGAESAWVDQVLGEEIGAALDARGLLPVSSGGDLGVLYFAAESEALDPREVLRSFRLLVDDSWADELPLGTLLVLVADGASGRVLWRASAQAVMRPDLSDDERRERLARHVDRLFVNLPIR